MDGAYAEDHMMFVVMSVSEDTEEALHGAEADADTLFETGSCTEVDVGDAAMVPSTSGCYELHFDTSVDTSTYDIDVSGVEHIVIFTEHLPTEFESDSHYLQTADGADVEPEHTVPEGDDDHADHDHDDEDDHAGHDHGDDAEDDHAGHDHGDEDDHAGHDHGEDEPYEWGGIFDVSEVDSIQWVAQKVDGAYADAMMTFIIMGVSSGDEATLEGAEPDADALFETGSCTEVDVGDAAIVPSTSTCYELHFDTSVDTSTYDIDVAGVNFVVIFTEHLPYEFESDTHYLQDASGDVEPAHELSTTDDHDGHDHGGSGNDYEWAGSFDVHDHDIIQWVSGIFEQFQPPSPLHRRHHNRNVITSTRWLRRQKAIVKGVVLLNMRTPR